MSGEVFFDSLDVHVAPYVPLAGIVQQKAKIDDNIDCDIMGVSIPIIFYSNFLVDGEIYDLSPEPRQLNIPWNKALFSSYNILFTLIVLLGVVYTVFEDRKFKINF